VFPSPSPFTVGPSPNLKPSSVTVTSSLDLMLTLPALVVTSKLPSWLDLMPTILSLSTMVWSIPGPVFLTFGGFPDIYSNFPCAKSALESGPNMCFAYVSKRPRSGLVFLSSSNASAIVAVSSSTPCASFLVIWSLSDGERTVTCDVLLRSFKAFMTLSSLHLASGSPQYVVRS